MKLLIPDSWRVLRFPEKRAELIEFLKELCGPSAEAPPDYDVFDIDEVVHFFFDDTDLGASGEQRLGDILFDEGEAETISRVTMRLESLINELGDASSIDFLKHRDWSLVKADALAALETLSARGLPRFSRE